MTSKRMFYLMIGMISLSGLLIIGAAYLANVQLHQQAAKLHDLKLNSSVLTDEQNGLAKAKKDVAKYTPLQKVAQTIVPQDKDQAQAVREIVNIAAAAGISPSSITFPASNLGATTSVSATATTGTAAPKATTLPSQLTPVLGIPGVYNLQITISQDPTQPVPYGKFIDFLSRLEQNRRTAQVSSITLHPDAHDRTKLSFTLIVDEFIKP